MREPNLIIRLYSWGGPDDGARHLHFSKQFSGHDRSVAAARL